MGKRELVALLSLSSCSLLIVLWLFLAVPRVCLWFVIVLFPDHTHLLFWTVPLSKDISEKELSEMKTASQKNVNQ